MAGSLEFLTAAAVFIAIGTALMMLPRQAKVGVLSAAFITVMVGAMAQPAQAASGGSEVVSEGRNPVAGVADTSPQGTQYQGLEYPEVRGTPLSDQEITDRILREAPDDLKLSVSNGSVRISGHVSDRKAAKRLVQDIKDIPGVAQLSYDLGLDN